MSTTGVSSKTFSIGALEASNAGGSSRVTRLAMVGVFSAEKKATRRAEATEMQERKTKR